PNPVARGRPAGDRHIRRPRTPGAVLAGIRGIGHPGEMETVRHGGVRAPALSVPATASTLTRAGARISTIGLFAVLPIALLVAIEALSIHHDFAFDFRQFWQGGRDVVNGISPYPSASELDRAGPTLD